MGPLLRRAIVFASCLALLPAGAYAKSKAKDDAQVQCKDGTMSKPGRGACSHHGGVAAPTAGDDRPEKAAASNARSAVETPKDAAEVQCKDGTMSKAGRGACSHHGGVAANAPRDTATSSDQARTEPERPAPSQTSPQGRAPATAPSRAPRAGQPTARCKDGTMSYSQHRSGTCSSHGGVAEWLAQ